MTTPEGQNGGLDWDRELGDIDFKGFRNPEDLLNRVIDEQATGTVEQRKVWQRTRAALAQHEERLHKQARSIVEAPSLPKGVKKDPFSQRYSFTIEDDSETLRHVVVKAQRLRGNWFCKSFQVDDNLINFNNSGRISDIVVDVRTESHKRLNIKRSIQLQVEKPDSMGYKSPSGYFFKLQGDGSLSNGESAEDFIRIVQNSAGSISFAPRE